jgi:glycosyltransferase involved in cell wall biosynthesis
VVQVHGHKAGIGMADRQDQGNGPDRMAIGYLVGEYPKVSHTFIQREVAALRALGWTVHTCTVRWPPKGDILSDQMDEAAQTFCIVDAARSPLHLIGAHFSMLTRHPGRWFAALRLAFATRSPGWRALLFQMFYFAEAAILARHLERQGARHLHNHFSSASCTVAMLTSVMSGIPFSFTMHGPDIFFEPMRWRIDEKIARAAFVACISDFCRSQAMLFSDRRHWDKLHVVHCGIEPDRYAGPSTATGADLLFVGRLAAVKGVPVLFDALRLIGDRLPGLRLTLIGDGPERPALMAEAAAMGLAGRVHFAGYKTSDEVAAALLQADLLVLPSFAEGVPVVLMEAMASGLPVVTSRIAGIPELVEDGVSGHLVPPGNPEALAEAIVGVLTAPDRAAMGAAGRRRVTRDFNTRTEAEWLAQLLMSVQTGGPRLPKRPEDQP